MMLARVSSKRDLYQFSEAMLIISAEIIIIISEDIFRGEFNKGSQETCIFHAKNKGLTGSFFLNLDQSNLRREFPMVPSHFPREFIWVGPQGRWAASHKGFHRQNTCLVRAAPQRCLEATNSLTSCWGKLMVKLLGWMWWDGGNYVEIWWNMCFFISS